MTEIFSLTPEYLCLGSQLKATMKLIGLSVSIHRQFKKRGRYLLSKYDY